MVQNTPRPTLFSRPQSSHIILFSRLPDRHSPRVLPPEYALYPSAQVPRVRWMESYYISTVPGGTRENGGLWGGCGHDINVATRLDPKQPTSPMCHRKQQILVIRNRRSLARQCELHSARIAAQR